MRFLTRTSTFWVAAFLLMVALGAGCEDRPRPAKKTQDSSVPQAGDSGAGFSAKVEELLEKNAFAEADQTVSEARKQDTENKQASLWTDLSNQIAKAKEARFIVIANSVEKELTTASESIERAEKELRDTELSGARAGLDRASRFLTEAESFQVDSSKAEWLAKADSRRQDLARRCDEVNTYAPSERFIRSSRKALQARDFDKSMADLDRARLLPHRDDEVAALDEQLKSNIGARLQVIGAPDGAALTIDGRPVKVGEVVQGLNDGKVKVALSAPGFLDETTSIEVSYPEVKKYQAMLVRVSEPQVWATFVVGDAKGYWMALGDVEPTRIETLVAQTYLLDAPKPAIRSKLKRLLETTGSPSDRAGKRASQDEVDRAIRAFGDSKTGAIKRLWKLASFVEKHPANQGAVLKQCKSQLLETLARIEKGCADCIGEGSIPCEACHGTGKANGLVQCPNCNGQQFIVCERCHGATTVKCPNLKCDHGWIWVDVNRGNILKDKEKRLCPVCHGKRVIPCPNKRCKDGKVACRVCNGTGQVPGKGNCPKCNGQRAHACETCDGTGERSKMHYPRRKEEEMKISQLFGESGN